MPACSTQLCRIRELPESRELHWGLPREGRSPYATAAIRFGHLNSLLAISAFLVDTGDIVGNNMLIRCHAAYVFAKSGPLLKQICLEPYMYTLKPHAMHNMPFTNMPITTNLCLNHVRPACVCKHQAMQRLSHAHDSTR